MAILKGFEALPPSDQFLLQQFSRGPCEPRAFSTIHQAFEHYAKANPDVIAAIHGHKRITYAELDAAANSLSHKLVSHGARPRERICLVVSRSIEMLAAILAILKSGCQYIPLDEKVVTQQTLFHIVHDASVRFILCFDKFQSKCFDLSNPSVRIEAIDGCLENRGFSSWPLEYNVSSDDGAYIIYTSGTTGKPKAVDVSHGNVMNLLSRPQTPFSDSSVPCGNLDIRPGVQVAQLLSVSFDMAAWEIFGTLCNGGTLCIRGSDCWAPTLEQVDCVVSTPSILATLNPAQCPNLKTIALAGEPCPKPLADAWSSRVALFNCCGPTEVTIVNTMHRQLPGQDISIGKPVANTSVYILDENEEPVQIGTPGIMWAGGRCVSRGYISQEETAKRFRPDKFAADGSMMFNTGDLCKWRADGTLVNLGRIDDQVKVKGFRVELNGVSAVLESYPGVNAACTILFEKQLWTFYEAQPDTDVALVHEHMKKLLPYYAVPTQHPCQNLPRTANGKVDKKVLAIWAQERKSNEATPQSYQPAPARSVYLVEEHNIATSLTNTSASSSDETIDSLHKKEVVTYDLPPKKGTHRLRALRHSILSLYRRLFSAALIGNVLAIIIISARAGGIQYLNTADFGAASSVNITISILMRQEYVINAIWITFCSVPRSMPLFIRRHCARVGIHLGGLHSGCGVAGALWFLLDTIKITYDVAKLGVRSNLDPVVLVFSWLPVLLLIGIIVSAHPMIRAKYHNHFEVTHRLLGWTLLVAFWIQTLTFIASPLRDSSTSFHDTIMHSLESVDFWFLFVGTLSVILPWLRLRRVNVRSEVLSSHAIRLHFDYCTPVPGTAVRISERPLLEWHAFATVAKPGEKGFSLIVSNAGDWTKRQIGRAPSSLYVRGIPACGVLRIVPLFRSVVLVATGSGIGPCLPIILAKKVPMRIFWSTPNPEETFGKAIIDEVFDADPDAVIHNTRTSGKPDMVAITWRLLQESNAEAVCIISNKSLTGKVVYAMETRGVPAYGAIWDS